MAKKILKTVCDTKQSNQQSSAVRFVVPGPAAQPAQPGQPAQRTAKTVVTVNFNTPDAANDFNSGKEYTITIDG